MGDATAEALGTLIAYAIDGSADAAGLEMVTACGEEVRKALVAQAVEIEALRVALETAGTDLIGFLGYFERLGSNGTAQSIQRTLDKIEDILAAPSPVAGRALVEAADAMAQDLMLYDCEGQDVSCLRRGVGCLHEAPDSLNAYRKAMAALFGGAAEGAG